MGKRGRRRGGDGEAEEEGRVGVGRRLKCCWLLASSAIPASSPSTGPLGGNGALEACGNRLPWALPQEILLSGQASDPVLWVCDGFHVSFSQLDAVLGCSLA